MSLGEQGFDQLGINSAEYFFGHHPALFLVAGPTGLLSLPASGTSMSQVQSLSRRVWVDDYQDFGGFANLCNCSFGRVQSSSVCELGLLTDVASQKKILCCLKGKSICTFVSDDAIV
eukprot:1145580-Pelagomonas_calceolata.AAC.2